MGSNLNLRSNVLVLRDAASGAFERFAQCPTDTEVTYRPYRFMPGDLVKITHPWVTDARIIDQYLSEEQIYEVRQYLVCLLCHRTCAGTCSEAAPS